MSRFLLYARKSSESEDRQVLSIDSQIHELERVAQSRELEVAAVLSESKSAKAPGRSVFGDLLREVAKGRADGLLCWKLDRLARNPVDGGALIWALDEGKLKEIVTPERTFTNTGNDKFWMSLEFGMAKKYVDDLADNVRRGNRAKLEQGWLPGWAPIGYWNNRETRTILPDPERFDLVRKVWDEVLKGTHPSRVHRMANDAWGLRTRKTKRRGGTPLAKSAFYALLGNPFYYGLLVRNGESYAGAHVPMITKDEFDRVRELLGRPNRPAREKHAFAYRGLIRCGECGAAVTAEAKVNRQGHHYTYYHCTKRVRPCNQRVIQVQELERQILATLERITIPDRFKDWALKHLEEVREREKTADVTVTRSVGAAYQDAEKRLSVLTDLRLRGLLTDEEYAKKREGLVSEKLSLKEQLARRAEEAGWFEPARDVFEFATLAKKRFEAGAADEKRQILTALGSNLTLRDRILRIQLEKPFLWLEEGHRSSAWWAIADWVRTWVRRHPTKIQWPQFIEKHLTARGSRHRGVVLVGRPEEGPPRSMATAGSGDGLGMRG